MVDALAAQETINEARACILNAVKIDPGLRALEGDVESAYHLLGGACEELKQGGTEYAHGAVAEAIDLLDTEESRFIAEDTGTLEDAIRLLAGISWD